MRVECRGPSSCTVGALRLAEELCLPPELESGARRCVAAVATCDLPLVPPVLLRGAGCYLQLAFKLPRLVLAGMPEEHPPTIRVVDVHSG